MHVVVTGAAGFIGSHTCERLLADGHRVTGIDVFDDYLYPAEPKRRNALELARSDRFQLVEADICDRAAAARVITPDVDVVCHLAALAGVRPSIAEPLRYLHANILGTGMIVERMRELEIKRLVFASSSSVYGARPLESDAFREDEPCLTPASPYAATKRMNELQLSTCRDLWGLGVYALRFFTVYGPRQRTDMAIAKFTKAIAKGTPITIYGDGATRRDYTYIDDIVRGVVAAIARVQPRAYEIINLGGSSTVALSELVSMIEGAVGRPAVVERLPPQPGDVPITFANVERAMRLLDYKPTTPPADGIARYWEWFARHGE